MHKQNLAEQRKLLMSNRRVLCTGNPDRPYTIAHGIRKLYPDASFVHLSNGWDLTDQKVQNKLREQFTKHNTFINASYIGHGIQSTLLDLCNQSVKFCDVVNIGSTNEYDKLGRLDYQQSKINLRNQSLSLNSYRFRTCHLILGHLKTGTDDNGRQIDIDTVCSMIPWLFEQNFEVPIMCIDSFKEPW